MRTKKTNDIATATLALTTILAGSLPAQQYAPPNQPDYQPAQAEQDPPSRVARIAVADGNVSLEPAGVDSFSQAELNYPLTAGDRVYADNTSEAELQTSGLAVRMGNGADVTLSTLTDQVAQFGLAQGSLRLRTRDLSAPDGTQATVEVDTPNGTVDVTRAGDIRVDSYPQDDTTVVTVSSGQVEISGPNLDTTLSQGQSLRLAGSNPVYTQPLRLLPPDALDNFDAARERERQQAMQQSEQYVDPGMIGAGDLGQYGDWNPDPEYGAVWFPRAVPANWVPYSNGHWAWVAPWGWTWVEAEPWGFAPFHYGRWAAFNGRWGWVPGPPPSAFAGLGARPPRPVYSPALVAFVGGPRFSLSIGFGGGSGGGVTAWFPLGPHEAYQPWYHASPAYVNRVNVTNIYTRNTVDLRNTFNNRTTNVYNTNVTNVTYVNRPAATVAVTQQDFASGRGVAQSQHIQLNPAVQRQLAQAPVLPHPLVTPQQGAAAPQAPARALPPSQARPVVETRQGFVRAGGNRAGEAAPAPTPQQAASQQQFPGRLNQQQGYGGTTNPRGASPTPAPAPVQTPAQARQPGAFPQQRDHAPVSPSQPLVTQQPPAPVRAPVAQAPVTRVQPAAPQQAAPAQMPTAVRNAAPIDSPQQYSLGRPVQRPPDAVRPLINKTEPQPAQPSFKPPAAGDSDCRSGPAARAAAGEQHSSGQAGRGSHAT